MYGFYINTIPDIPESASGVQIHSIQTTAMEFRHVSFAKFHKDKIFTETGDYILGIDGVLLNLQQLYNAYARKGLSDLILYLYRKEKEVFPKHFKGVFSGFIYEKKTEKLLFFNDKTATKQVFYSQVGAKLLIAPNLTSIAKARESCKAENALHIRAVYAMFTFSGMIDDQTLINDVHKLGAGACILFENGKSHVAKYYDYNQIPISIHDKAKAIRLFNDAFVEAVRLEYLKDETYGYTQIATLSGGLDSRMNLLVATDLGFKPETFCFSQSGYADDTISRKIADDLGLKHHFVPLDGGDFLKSISEMLTINSGLHFYHGSAHYHYALKQAYKKSFGLMHTGQIGDGLLGGLITKNKAFLSKANSRVFLPKLNLSEAYLQSFRDEEVYKIYQRVFNLTNFGSFVVEQHQTYLVSPFYDDDVMRVALSIEPKLKINQNIYIDWILEYHPKATQYVWERTGFKPDKKWKTALSRYTNKLKKEYYKSVGKQQKLSMNPYEFWLASNKSVADYIDRFFQDRIDLISHNGMLAKDINAVYNTDVFLNKSIVITLLETIRMLNLKV